MLMAVLCTIRLQRLMTTLDFQRQLVRTPFRSLRLLVAAYTTELQYLPVKPSACICDRIGASSCVNLT